MTQQTSAPVARLSVSALSLLAHCAERVAQTVRVFPLNGGAA